MEVTIEKKEEKNGLPGAKKYKMIYGSFSGESSGSLCVAASSLICDYAAHNSSILHIEELIKEIKKAVKENCNSYEVKHTSFE